MHYISQELNLAKPNLGDSEIAQMAIVASALG
jgi:hypothetical protein